MLIPAKLPLMEMPIVPALRGTTGRTLSCISCGLMTKGALTPQIPPFGNGRKRLMLIGEGPGEQEDRLGKPWQGRAGRTLSRALRDLGIDLEDDCISLNTVNCRPPKNRAPTPHEIACCRKKFVQPAIESEQPAVMVLLGGSAVGGVLGGIYREADDRIGRWRGLSVPIPEWGAWVCPTFHPSYVMREEQRADIRTVWESDLANALTKLDKPVPPLEDLRPLVHILRGEAEIVPVLQRVLQRKGRFSFDYETTGLKAIVHKVVCASFAQTANRAYAFMFDGSPAVAELWRQILLDDQIEKISHNLKFEQEWSAVHFQADTIRWGWDGMLAAHVIDNRPGICGLKHQAFLNFGIRDYDSHVLPYLKSINDKDPTAPNRIIEYIETNGPDEVLIYCGLDSLVELRLAIKQWSEMQ